MEGKQSRLSKIDCGAPHESTSRLWVWLLYTLELLSILTIIDNKDALTEEVRDEIETRDEGTESNEEDDNDCKRNYAEDHFESMEAESDEDGKLEEIDEKDIAANQQNHLHMENLVRNEVVNNDNEANEQDCPNN